MKKSKTGKTPQDIFAPTATVPKAPGRNGTTAPPTPHREEWRKVTVVLTNHQVVFLDRLAADIRERSGSVVKRTEIVRALIDSLERAELDTAQATSADDIRDLLGARLAAGL